MKNRFCGDDDCEIAVYTDANSDVDMFFRKLSLIVAVVSAIIITLVGTVSAIMSVPAGGKNVKSEAVILEAVQVSSNTGESYATPVPTEKPRTVLLDAGHGGFDPGSQGSFTGVYESDINLAITKKVEELLKGQGYNVIMTRTDENALAPGKDGDMQARVDMITSCDADIFVCIHQNAFEDESVCGAEVYYHPTKPMAYSLAKCVEDALLKMDNLSRSRGIKQYGHMLTKYIDYSILIECGFVTNREEEAKLVSDSYQNELAGAIVEGINSFFENCYGQE